MTFSEIEAALYNTGRRGYAGSVLAFLLDAYDRGNVQVEKHIVVAVTGITDTNVAAVVRRLEEQGIIYILYWDTKADNPKWSSLRNGAWSIPSYRLARGCKIICVNGIFSKTFKGLQNAYQQRSY